MTYQEERLARLKRQRSKQAIDLAMQGRWQEAVAANKFILENFPRDVDAYNRLGRAYMELGEYAQAREAYRRTIELDSFNAIARKNLQRLSYLGEAEVAGLGGESRKIEPHHFIEEIGKAGVVSLYHLAPTEIRARMVAGDEVYLKIDGPSLIVENSRREYLGQVEPKHGQRLIKFMEGGNRYFAAIVSSTEEAMSVIIREVYQDPSQAGRLSFPSRETKVLRPYVDERVFKLESEYEEAGVEEPGYTIIGGDEIEVLPEEPADIGDDMSSDEE
ncbi:MAG TPA: tetratricopeptide repeat protein [Dehalococcoidales bacterium]|nr:tetratricopeptide repeat protein [Dehalococcoidales bacterium]